MVGAKGARLRGRQLAHVRDVAQLEGRLGRRSVEAEEQRAAPPAERLAARLGRRVRPRDPLARRLARRLLAASAAVVRALGSVWGRGRRADRRARRGGGGGVPLGEGGVELQPAVLWLRVRGHVGEGEDGRRDQPARGRARRRVGDGEGDQVAASGLDDREPELSQDGRVARRDRAGADAVPVEGDAHVRVHALAPAAEQALAALAGHQPLGPPQRHHQKDDALRHRRRHQHDAALVSLVASLASSLAGGLASSLASSLAARRSRARRSARGD